MPRLKLTDLIEGYVSKPDYLGSSKGEALCQEPGVLTAGCSVRHRGWTFPR
jgi:hypothetical protein